MKERDRYLKIVKWSDEDDCYTGSVPGWIGECCHGDNEEKVYRKLCQIVDEWIQIYAKDGRPLPPPPPVKNIPGSFSCAWAASCIKPWRSGPCKGRQSE